MCDGECVKSSDYSVYGVARWGGVCGGNNTVVLEMKSTNGQFYNVAVIICDLKKENSR